ncbi:MAG TPA: penicillin acylase family protein [Solirubrobacterales bacterium]|nr:penicillin acylase family protein [Solirubrobacterales bacterium]
MGMDPRRLLRGGVKGMGIGTALAGATAAGLWWRLFRRPLPRTQGEIAVSGLDGRVEIARDRWGMPTVRAETPTDLWFGQGFCHGQDRLWQVDIQRRICSGRVSEIAGRAGLPVDRLMRTLGLRRIALREETELDGDLRPLLDAYCAGLNQAARMASVPPAEFQLLRLEFEPWRPADMLAGGKLLSFGLSTNWERELLRADLVRELGEERAAKIDPTYPKGNPVVLQPGHGFEGDGLGLAEQIGRVRDQIGLAAAASGSNNWAVAASRSMTDGALLAGDPHLPSGMPGVWYEIALEIGDRTCRGASIPGLPGISLGQNNDVAFAFTNVMADVEDLFVERVEGETYEFRGDQRPLEIVEELIVIRGQVQPERHEVRLTHHGPIVNQALGADDQQPLALRWAALDLPSIAPAHLGVLEPTSGPELVEMLRSVTMPVSNLVWADRHGSIGYKMMGRVPRRKGDCPDLPKPGWTGEFEWEGWIPYDELPELVDPEEGFIVTANNRVVGDDYPHHITSDWLDGYRAARIEQLLKETEEHDLESFRRMQTDLYSIPGDEVVHRLARLSPNSQREVRAIERLKSWDRTLNPRTVAGTIYQAFLLRLAREFTRAAIGDRDLADRYLDRADNGFIAHVTSPWRWQSHLLDLWEEGDEGLIGGSWDELALEALRGALDDLEERFGPDPGVWQWGHVHQLHFPHALGAAHPLADWIFNRTLHPGGAQETVAQIAYDPNDPYHAIWAPSWRMVADASAPERSRWQAFTGQSGHAWSRHYDDLQPRWEMGAMQSMAGEAPFETLVLTPADGAAPH